MRRRLLALLPALLALPACDSDDPGADPPMDDLELITRIEVTLMSRADSSTVTLIAVDENGDGAGIEYGDRGLLAAGTTYAGTIRLADEPNGRDVTEEIRGEADEHLFTYGSTVDGVDVTVTDTESDYLDDQGFEDYAVGLAFDVTVEAGASGNGTLTATLYHFASEGEDGAKASSFDTSDEIDVELAFPISVE